ncbi:MAG TPA: DUF4010 domain-containing protein [Vicinamibacteria bacterium]
MLRSDTLNDVAAGLAQALLIGLLLGLERERSRAGDQAEGFAGIRTFPLFTLAGFLAAVLAGPAPLALPALLIAVAALAVTFQVVGSEGKGATTETAALLAVLLGAAVGFGHGSLAAAVAVVATLLLTLKAPLHRLARAVSQDEILAILKFGVVALIVLPLLPDRGLGPYQAVNPRDVGLMVVLLTAISLAGYLLVRYFGEGKGYALAGLLGGLASSTAVALSFSRKAREAPDLARPLAAGIVVASTMLYARGALVLMALDGPLGRHLLPRLGALFVAGLAVSFVLLKRAAAPRETGPALSLDNPVELGHALLLAALFAVVLLLARVAQAELGTTGLWTVGAVGGLVDVDSVAVAAARLRAQDVVEVPVAAGAYLLATVSNLIFKSGVTILAGGAALARQVLPAFGVLAVLTVGALLL